MKKNDCSMLFYFWSKIKKWLFLMKLIAFFFFSWFVAGECNGFWTERNGNVFE